MARAVLRAVGFFILGVLLTTSILTGVGLVVALVRDGDARDSVAWALIIGGAIVALLVGGSGSPSVNMQGSREVVGGRFVTPVVPLPETPLVWALVGFACAGIGIMLFLA
jgi:hypothetical protein